jgi:hypothetical protein
MRSIQPSSENASHKIFFFLSPGLGPGLQIRFGSMDPTKLGSGPDPDTKHPKVSKECPKPYEKDGFTLLFRENWFEIFIDHPKN